MKIISIDRDLLLFPVSRAASASKKTQLPILECLKLTIAGGRLTVIGSDLQIQVSESISLEGIEHMEGSICVPARKLSDILKKIQTGASVSLQVEDGKAIVRAGRSRFSLATFSGDDFPNVDSSSDACTLTMMSADLRSKVEKVKHAMANGDVRYYLNGMLICIKANVMRFVATDGHRLAMSESSDFESTKPECSVIIPNNSVSLILALLGGNNESVRIALTNNHATFAIADSKIVTKLIDGKYPDFEKVIPRDSKNKLVADITSLKSSVNRSSILSNEKYKGIIFDLSQNLLSIRASNSESEEAEDFVEVEYTGTDVSIGVNGDYVKDALSALGNDDVCFTIKDSNSSMLVTMPSDPSTKLVLMPMRL